MKILHVITSLRIGGAEKLMVDLLPRLQQMGHEVAIYVFLGLETPLSQQLRSAGVKVIMGGENESVYSPRHILVLRRLIPNYDLVHTHNTSPQLFAAIANIGRHMPLVTTEHNTVNRRRKHLIFRPIDRWMYRQYQRIICVSEPCFTNLQNHLGQDNCRAMCCINNGIDTMRFANAIASTEYTHSTLHASRIIINVAGFRWEKDQPTIIRAMQLLPDDYHLLLIGVGERMNACQQLAQSIGVDARVHFLGVRTDVPELLKAADVVVMSSHHEGLSLSNLEGMAAGKPFVASDVDGLREIVSEYGLLFPHEDEKALAHEIRKLCGDPQYAAEVAARCRQRALRFDINKMAAGYNAVYYEVMASAK